MPVKLNDQALEVAQAVVNDLPDIQQISLVAHMVEDNWRQKHSTTNAKINNLDSALSYVGLADESKFSRKEFLNLTYQAIPKLEDNHVWSFSSRVLRTDGGYRHLPMMNFHPEDATILPEVLVSFPKKNFPYPGALLESGRYYHYWGTVLLNEDEWHKFLATFLMPCIFVSPRYIGHSLRNDACTLRLTADKTFKPTVPYVIDKW